MRYQGFNCDGVQPINSLCLASDTGELFTAVDPKYIMQQSHLETSWEYPGSYYMFCGYGYNSSGIFYPAQDTFKVGSPSSKSVWIHWLYYFEENKNRDIDWGAKYYPNRPSGKITELFNPQVTNLSGTVLDYFEESPTAGAPFITGYTFGSGAGDDPIRYSGFYFVPVSLTSKSGSNVTFPTLSEEPWTLSFHVYVEGLWDQDINVKIQYYR